ncbi:hypothetical protein OTK56_16650 [Vibrio caribbeanicus]|nr:hypothetical protein [Vibrio caribbeanicus]MCY9846082.1 hypothetical protein [Vibrio caribbeanicus]
MSLITNGYLHYKKRHFNTLYMQITYASIAKNSWCTLVLPVQNLALFRAVMLFQPLELNAQAVHLLAQFAHLLPQRGVLFQSSVEHLL